MGVKLQILSAGKMNLMSGEWNFPTGPLSEQAASRKDLRHLLFQVWWIFLIPLITELPMQ